MLQKVKVSHGDAEEFEKLIKERVRSWKEETVLKRRIGINLKDYDGFLESFQKSAGIDNKIVDGLRHIKFSRQSDELIKHFWVSNTDSTGSFGLIGLTKNNNTIDLAYAVYNISVEFKAATLMKTKTWKIFGIPFLSLEEEEFYQDFDFTSVNFNKLQENYIKAKAMQSFLSEGILTKINYVSSINDAIH